MAAAARCGCTGGCFCGGFCVGLRRGPATERTALFLNQTSAPEVAKDSGVYVFAILGNRVYIIRRQRSREHSEVVPGETETETIREVNGQ